MLPLFVQRERPALTPRRLPDAGCSEGLHLQIVHRRVLQRFNAPRFASIHAVKSSATFFAALRHVPPSRLAVRSYLPTRRLVVIVGTLLGMTKPLPTPPTADANPTSPLTGIPRPITIRTSSALSAVGAMASPARWHSC